MAYGLITQFCTLLLDLITVIGQSEQQKNLELLLLRQQLRMLQRKRNRAPHISRMEKLILAVLSAKVARLMEGKPARLGHMLLLFKPETVLKWHRELVRRKWTFKRRGCPGRPPINADLAALIVRLARENPRWGYGKIQGELRKLGHRVARSTVQALLQRQHVPPAPQRMQHGSTWRMFLGHYKDEILACACFTVETVWLKTLYILFVIEVGSRRVHLAGCTANPTTAWVTQQARHIGWKIEEDLLATRFLIHDRDAKFPPAFDAVFQTVGVTSIRTPYQAPNANAFAERWIRSVREECLDHLLILNERHLQRVLSAYGTYFNHARPHQGINQQCPIRMEDCGIQGSVRRRDVLGSIIHDYYRQAA